MTDLAVTSGLNIAQNTLNSIASNVANVSTPGFKAGSYSFTATFAASANAVLSDPSAGVVRQFSQGGIGTTGNPLNAAINGLGFFRLKGDDGAISYTRDGEFAIGSKGQLQSVNGAYATGYMAVDKEGNISPTLSNITLSEDPQPPAATKTVKMNVNLAGGAQALPRVTIDPLKPAVNPFDPLNPKSYTDSQTVEIYDPSGVSHSLQTYFVVPPQRDLNSPALDVNGTPILDAKGQPVYNLLLDAKGQPIPAPNTYLVYHALDGKVVMDAAAPTMPIATTLHFKDDGTQLIAPIVDPVTGSVITPANPASITVNLNSSLPGVTFPVDLNITKISQYGTAYQPVSIFQDGYAIGNFTGFSISQDGKISASYSNGQSAVQAQLALANFVNPNGMTVTNNGLLLESAASGQPTVGAPGTGALGVLQAAALESANVDVAAAMVDMITAQRNYQANAQAVKINDQIMQTLVSLR